MAIILDIQKMDNGYVVEAAPGALLAWGFQYEVICADKQAVISAVKAALHNLDVLIQKKGRTP